MLNRLHQAVAQLEGDLDGPGPAPVHRSVGAEPYGLVPGAVRVLGRCVTLHDDEHARPLPDPHMLSTLHTAPSLGGLTVWLDVRQREVRWSWKAQGGLHLRRVLAAAFGPDLVQVSDRPNGPSAQQAAILGSPCPMPTPRDGPIDPAGVDLLIEAGGSQAWTLLVVARPVSANDVGARHAAFVELLDLVQRLPQEDRGHPQVASAAEVVERARRHLSEHRAAGIWEVGAWLLAQDEATLDVLTVVAGAVFGARPDAVRPLQLHRCTRDGNPHLALQWLDNTELARLIAPPERDWPGFRRVEQTVFDQHVDPSPGGRSWELGQVVVGAAAMGPVVALDLDRLTRHALVCGVTGSGKTKTIQRLLCEAWRRHHVPFLVIEPTKAEYRGLPASLGLPDAQVFTPGIEEEGRGWPLRLDPLDVPEGVPLALWADGLLALLQAAFVLYPPMPYVLQAGILRTYADAGWDIVGPRRGRHPRLADLKAACLRVTGELGYHARIAADVRAAIRARLDTLTDGPRGLLYDSGSHNDDADLFDRPAVVELDGLPREEDRAFLMGLLVLRLGLRRRYSAAWGPSATLRHLLVLEEAHCLLRDVPESGSTEGGDGRARAVRQFADLVSEVRAYGQGVVIADQVPSRLVEDAIKNTDLKIIHRLVARDDRELVGGAVGMDEEPTHAMTRLRPGQVVLYQEPFDRPVLVQVALEQTAAAPSLADLADRGARAIPAKPYWGCHACPSLRSPCGHVLGPARQLATASYRPQAVLACAAKAVHGKMIDVPVAWPAAQARCLAWTLATHAAARMGDAMGLTEDRVIRLARVVAEGGSFVLSAPRAPGQLAACGSCPDPCRWRPLGATNIGDADRWASVSETNLDALLAPIRLRLAVAYGPDAAATMPGAVYCVAAHEMEQSLLRRHARMVGGLLTTVLHPEETNP